MTKISINKEKLLGKIKPMHGVGQPPLMGIKTERFQYLEDANIPYSRLHDVAGWFGGNMYVDIPNIFRDFDADVEDPASYDFTFTDILIKGLIDHKCEPVYRLGVTIENFADIKAYRVYPPKDFHKWARICEHIIRHYNEGWADGFHYNIKYWEIWNEPEGHYDSNKNGTWKGTKEEYFELYKTAATHLKECFGDSIKVGGYSSCGFHKLKEKQDVTGEAFGTTAPITDWDRRCDYFMEFFYDFMDMIIKDKVPLDFFSYHSYSRAGGNLKMQAFAEKFFDEHGLSDVEFHLNEWNTCPRREERGTSLACATAVANMCALQNTRMAMMCFYDARIGTSVYGGLFNPLTLEPFCTYYGFKAFGNLYKMGTQIECNCDNELVYSLAATDGEKIGVLIANRGPESVVELNLNSITEAYLIDENHMYEKVEITDGKYILTSEQTLYVEGK